MKALLLCLVFCLMTTAYAEPFQLRIIGPQSPEDNTKSYFEELFSLALKQSLGQETEVAIVRIPSSETLQTGLVRLLNKGFVDLIWTATDKEIEQQVLPVRIPLVMGMLGYRVAMTHSDNLYKFESIEDLKYYTACQVRYWTDVDILDHNKFNVVATGSYENTFQLTHKKRCDYFPRAIFEAYPELEASKKRFPGLAIFDDVLLYYPFPFYAFTSHDNKKLNGMLYDGLKQLAYSGEMLALMQRSEVTRHLFPLSQWKNKQIVRLQNPFLPEATPTDDPHLWLDLGKKRP